MAAVKKRVSAWATIRWKRHVEGWGLGLFTLSIPVLALGLILPRPAIPLLPLPHVDRAEEHASLVDLLGQVGENSPLSFEARQIGEAVRLHGWASATGNETVASQQAARAQQLAHQLHQGRPLVQLRAVQTHLFLSALAGWEATGHTSRELLELGGDFAARARASGWFRQGRLSMTLSERAVLFEARWNRLVGVEDIPTLALSQNQWCVYYRFLLEHPLQSTSSPHDRETLQLSYLGALARHDPSYPVDLARGALHYRRANYSAAIASLRAHLEAHPDGPWALRARNALAAAVLARDASSTP